MRRAASLAWPEPSTKFTAEYWGEQAKADSEIWREAVDWCAEDTRKLLLNCQTVGQVQFIRTLKDSADRRSEPYDGKGGVQMPPAVQQQLEAETHRSLRDLVDVAEQRRRAVGLDRGVVRGLAPQFVRALQNVDQEGAPVNGRFERSYRYTVVDTIGGGTSEIQKNIISRRGLGLPANF